MNGLELKFPPPLVTSITALLMWLTSLYLPSILLPKSILLFISLLLVIVGGSFAILGVWIFKKSKTTVNPRAPQNTATLVTSGVFQITRNPMYVGLLLCLIAWSVYLSNLYSLSLSIVFVLYMNRFQIQVEEKVLLLKFPEAFDTYSKNVRRWL